MPLLFLHFSQSGDETPVCAGGNWACPVRARACLKPGQLPDQLMSKRGPYDDITFVAVDRQIKKRQIFALFLT